MERNSVHLGDCLDVMQNIDDKSIDMILCDLPYGTTACKWDTVIPFEPLWNHYKRIIKDNGAIVLTASQPFSSALVMSNIKMFKYEWIWYKNLRTGFATAKFHPMKSHEKILVFGKKATKYNPIKVKRTTTKSGTKTTNFGDVYGNFISNQKPDNQTDMVNPHTVIDFIKAIHGTEQRLHPTQKPVELFEYMIKTYTNEGDLVLDNCAGSGTTAIACINTNRDYILIEKEQKYYDIINERIKKTMEG